jgi:hypothetical protein
LPIAPSHGMSGRQFASLLVMVVRAFRRLGRA